MGVTYKYAHVCQTNVIVFYQNLIFRISQKVLIQTVILYCQVHYIEFHFLIQIIPWFQNYIYIPNLNFQIHRIKLWLFGHLNVFFLHLFLLLFLTFFSSYRTLFNCARCWSFRLFRRTKRR